MYLRHFGTYINQKTINMQQVFCSAKSEKMHTGPLVDFMWNDTKINLRQTAHPPMEHTARQNKLYCIEVIGIAIFRDETEVQSQCNDLHKF